MYSELAARHSQVFCDKKAIKAQSISNKQLFLEPGKHSCTQWQHTDVGHGSKQAASSQVPVQCLRLEP